MVEVVGLRKEIKIKYHLKKSLLLTPSIVPLQKIKKFIGEDYVFDSRVKDVDRDRISLKCLVSK